MPRNLFVYGTLLFDDVVRLLTGRTFPTVRAVLRDHRRYNVCVPGREVVWPAIVFEKGGQVRGKLLMNVANASLAVIERFENTPPEYETVNVFVQLEDNREEEVLAYRALPQIWNVLKGEWCEDAFERTQLRKYLTELAKEQRGEDAIRDRPTP